MTPSRTREVAEELALRWPAQTRSEQIDAVAEALHAAEERGRVAGLEQAAKEADHAQEERDAASVDPRVLSMPYLDGHAIATAIRSLIGDAK